VPDGVDPVAYGIEPSARNAVIDRIFSEPQLNQLTPRNHSVLPLRQFSDFRIAISTSPRQSAYFAG
jgi:hypothetical protein